MIKNVYLFSVVLVVLLGTAGCSKKRIVIQAPVVQKAQDNTWANETNVEENIDISDLERSDTTTQQEMSTRKQKSREKMERMNFPVGEYQRLATRGKGTIQGSIYIKDAYERRVVGSGTRLYLNPVTSYSKQWYKESYIGGYKMEKADKRLFNYLRFTAANDKGEFAFYGVPSGSYYLIGTVECGSQCGYSVLKSIRIANKVRVEGNQVVTKDLSRLID